MTPQTWTINALSVELGIDRRSLARRLEGLSPMSERKIGRRTERLYRMRDVFAHLQSSGEDKLDINVERARLAQLQGEKLQIEIAEVRGRLISTDAVVEHWSGMVTEARGKLLALPARATLMVVRKTEAEICAVLTDLIYEALHAFARSAIPPDIEARIRKYETEVTAK